MTFKSYETKGLITSDFVLVKRGEHKNRRGHVINIHPHTVDILLKFTDGLVINVNKKDIFLKQRMFLRTKDLRSLKEDKLSKQLEKMSLGKSLDEEFSSLIL